VARRYIGTQSHFVQNAVTASDGPTTHGNVKDGCCKLTWDQSPIFPRTPVSKKIRWRCQHRLATPAEATCLNMFERRDGMDMDEDPVAICSNDKPDLKVLIGCGDCSWGWPWWPPVAKVFSCLGCHSIQCHSCPGTRTRLTVVSPRKINLGFILGPFSWSDIISKHVSFYISNMSKHIYQNIYQNMSKPNDQDACLILSSVLRCSASRGPWFFAGLGEPPGKATANRPGHNVFCDVFICFLPSIFLFFVGKNTDFGHTW